MRAGHAGKCALERVSSAEAFREGGIQAGTFRVSLAPLVSRASFPRT
jgi:hypothetical protein